MNRRFQTLVLIIAILSVPAWALAQPVGTSFTYQGRLKESGLPATAPIDLQFNLFDAATGGAPLTTPPLCRDNVPVADGLFNVSLDFGNQFTGLERWLAIGVRPAGVGDCTNAGGYTPLNARQKVDGVPYAQWSNLGPGGGGDCCDGRIDVNTLPGISNILHIITQPGSYYLSGNVNGAENQIGIGITANDVTLDLNGFAIVGAADSGTGITTLNQITENVVIRNGHVRSWGSAGIAVCIRGGRIEHINVTNNGSWGISNVTGAFGTCEIISCRVSNNAGGGIKGGYGVIIRDCVSRENTGIGISGEASCTLLACRSEGNTGKGIYAQFGSQISGCTAISNGEQGIFSSTGTISDCIVAGNQGHGIDVTSRNRVANNQCYQNGTAGGSEAEIHVSGSNNRIEGNNCTNGVRGIKVDSGGNIIIKNTCSGNMTNWDVVAGNKIHVVAPAAAGAVTGNSGGTALDPDPNANFSY